MIRKHIQNNPRKAALLRGKQFLSPLEIRVAIRKEINLAMHNYAR